MRLVCLGVLTVLLGRFASAQRRPEQGATEIQLWTAGGHSVPGGRGDTGIWNAGLRYGWNLRNFLTLEMLAKLKRIVFDDGAPDE